jgi:hypothetical protein
LGAEESSQRRKKEREGKVGARRGGREKGERRER